MIKLIRIIILLALLIGLTTAGIDYYLLINNHKPVFNIREYNEIKHIESFRGLFYQARRETHISDKEQINDSKNVRFIFILYKINIPINKIKSNKKSNINILKSNDCIENQSIYIDTDDYIIKLNCIDSIKVNNNQELNEIKNSKTVINSIINKSLYLGSDETIEKYQIKTDKNEIYKLLKCKNKNIYLITENEQNLDCVSE